MKEPKFGSGLVLSNRYNTIPPDPLKSHDYHIIEVIIAVHYSVTLFCTAVREFVPGDSD